MCVFIVKFGGSGKWRNLYYNLVKIDFGKLCIDIMFYFVC